MTNQISQAPQPVPPQKPKRKLSNLSNLILKIMLGVFAVVCFCAIVAILATGLSDSTGRLLGVGFYVALFGGLCFCCSLIYDSAKHPASKFIGIAGMILHVVIGAAASIFLILGPNILGSGTYQRCYITNYDDGYYQNGYDRTVDSTYTPNTLRRCQDYDVDYYTAASVSCMETYFIALFAILLVSLFLLIQNRHRGTTIVRNSTITTITLFAVVWVTWLWVRNFIYGNAFFNEMTSRVIIVLGILTSLGAVASVIMNYMHRDAKKTK